MICIKNYPLARPVLFFLTQLIFSSPFLAEAAPSSSQEWHSRFQKMLKNGGAYVEDASGQVLFQYRANESFIPASTLKIATTSAALDTFGGDYKFRTEFYLRKPNMLVVKGYGDPFLVSEELRNIATQLAQKETYFSKIILDDTFFAPDIEIDGRSRTDNPYDALNGALLANFNTIFVERKKNGTILSAESQTPLTPTAIAFARRLPLGKSRVNLGSNREVGLRHFGELLRIFLQQEGVKVEQSIQFGSVVSTDSLLLRHLSSETLSDLCRSMLKFSTNFLANQLFLLLSEDTPASVQGGQKALTNYLRRKIHWQHFHIEEGAGLSHKNSVTPKEMVQLLRYFEPNRELLSPEESPFLAKTGSLQGVNTLIGYFETQDYGRIRFAILINDNVPHRYKFQVAHALVDFLSNSR